MPEDHATGVILTPVQEIDHLKRRVKGLSQMLRETNFKLKLAHKQIGKQGDTIYNLRGNVGELQGLISKEDRGVFRRIQAQYDDLYGEHQKALEYIETLKKKLDEAETKEPVEVDTAGCGFGGFETSDLSS